MGGTTVEPGPAVVGAAEVVGAVPAATVVGLECFEGEELHAPMSSVAATATATVRAVVCT